MTTISILLAVFLVIGLFARKFNPLIRLLLMTIILVMIVYITFL